MNLSPHFTLAEASKSQTATRRGLDNRPPAELHSALSLVANNILEPVRAHFGIPFTPSSWYRSSELNKIIGGSLTSQHTRGEAADIEVPGVPNIELARWIESALAFDQLILEFYNEADPTAGWVHISCRANANRHQTLTIGKSLKLAGLPVQNTGSRPMG